MKKINKYIMILVSGIVLSMSSCEKFYDINKDPDALLDAPLSTILSSVTVNVGYFAGSDLNRYSSLIMQQYSGQSNGTLNQTQEYDKYLITGQDSNNLFGTAYADILSDLEIIIAKGTAEGSPNYSGVAKLLKAYMFQVMVDAYGDLPYTEAFKLTANVAPNYDNDEQIYSSIITLIDQGIAEVTQTVSKQSPGDNSTIYSGDFDDTRANWIKFGNTLKLRIYLHYSEKDAAFLTTKMNDLVNSGATFLSSNDDDFQMEFLNEAGGRNPIDQFETSRAGYLVAGYQLVNMMNTNTDPRRSAYFTALPSAPIYNGAVVGAANNSTIYSKLNTYLRGSKSGIVYSGAAPVRMLTYAEYNFIRAEAALRFGVVGNAQTFFENGITASLNEAGVSAADITTYITDHGTLTGTDANKLQQIIEQKYIASYGVLMEPWTDWRRTGLPAITLPTNAVTTFVPRALYYPQSEVDTNPNIPGGKQKPNLNVRVFWDTRN